MFKRVLAKLGVGSATVNLVLDKDEYTLGDTVEGQILVEGGTVEQRINKIDVDLVTERPGEGEGVLPHRRQRLLPYSLSRRSFGKKGVSLHLFPAEQPPDFGEHGLVRFCHPPRYRRRGRPFGPGSRSHSSRPSG